MSNSLLVITPQASFGEHIRQSLEESSPAYVEIVDSKVAALQKLEERRFSHAFLDRDLRNESIPDLGLALRARDPNLRLVVISARESMPRFDVLKPWILLHKPFFLADLLRIVDGDSKPAISLSPMKETVIENDKKEDPLEDGHTLVWLKDVNKAAQHLTRLTLESSAQAALIIRREKMWAYAGQLSDEASAELVRTVIRDKKTGDLLKFLRLKTTQAEHMLYATQLGNTAILVMIFDAETPFSAIRRQATHLSESLEFSLQSKDAPVTPPAPSEEKSPQAKEDDDLIDLFDFDGEENGNLPPISEILENIPNPTPLSGASDVKTSVPTSTPSPPSSPQISASSAVFDEPMPNPFAKARADISTNNANFSPREQSPAIRAEDFYATNQNVDLDETRLQEAQPQQSIDIDLDETRVQAAQKPDSIEIDLAATRISKPQRPETPVSKPKKDELIATRPHSITEVAGRSILESAPTGTYDLTYACLLVPRFGTHHLTGDLADRLSEWMPNICVAFGWRLDHLSVRPDYLQWVVNVPPTVSPGYLMRIMRKQTSERIFEDFPRQKKENPSGDFWAPGYLIMGGSQPHPSTLVKDYIRRTRERQGM
ncbi:MAG: IS200/IS605 family transposase [Chloroflexi bacterium]|nr:IS200/IS605 family transposase [Chloroflexota bacterium]